MLRSNKNEMFIYVYGKLKCELPAHIKITNVKKVKVKYKGWQRKSQLWMQLYI